MLVIPALLGWALVYSDKLKQGRSIVGIATGWFGLITTVHFVWLYILLAVHCVTPVIALVLTMLIVTLATGALSGGVIVAVVVYQRMGLSSGSYLWALMSTLVTWYGFELWGLWWLNPGVGCCYPYLSPWTILSSAPWFLRIVFCIGGALGYGGSNHGHTSFPAVQFLPLGYQRSWYQKIDPRLKEAGRLEQRMYHDVVACTPRNDVLALVCAPESALTCEPGELVRLLKATVNQSPSSHYLVGCSAGGAASGHSVAWINAGKVRQIVSKQIFTPITEQIPWGGVLPQWVTERLFPGAGLMQREPFDSTVLHIAQGLTVRPFICADFFISHCLMSRALKQRQHGELWALFVNDSWFAPYLVQQMINYVCFNSALYNQEVLYIGHVKSLSIRPFSGTFGN